MLSKVDTQEKIEFNKKILFQENVEQAKRLFSDRKGQAWLMTVKGYDVDYSSNDFQDGKN